MKKAFFLILILAAAVYFGWEIAHIDKMKQDNENLPVWIENDSAKAIASRTASDFSLTREQALDLIHERHADVTEADLDTFIAKHYIEAMTIDGQQRIHRKSPRNLDLLNPDYNGGARYRGDHASEARISYVDSVLGFHRGKNSLGLSRKVTFRFSIDVPYDKALQGDTLRVWMPLPLDNPEGKRQSDVTIIDADPAAYTLSDGRSVHNTIYFEGPAAEKEGETAHFEYVGSFITSGAWMSEKEILSRLRPYDKSSETYRKYT
ncbi:MAG: hypothetical protein K2F63_00895, partial [Muribaculaceae bacterium]|nr:hypothetical protein [Muribaculaceae bacterium]